MLPAGGLAPRVCSVEMMGPLEGDAVVEAIEVVGLDLLPGSRHGLEGPTALVQLRWQGVMPTDDEARQLQEHLAGALWFQERMLWKRLKVPDWRDFRPAIPVRGFPDDFLLEPAPDVLSGLLAAGITALQWGASLPVGAARVVRHEGHQIDLAVPFYIPQLLESALEWTLTILRECTAWPGDPTAQAERLEAREQGLEAAFCQQGLDEDSFSMAWLARQRGLPLVRLDFGVVEIGHGRSRRRFMGSLQGVDGVASVLASNKVVIKRQLLRAGLPVPAYAVVDNEDQVLAAAREMGWPVVLKPIDQSKSRGVTANVWRAPDLLRAYRMARTVSQKPLLLEKHVLGHDHRILVLDGEVVGAVTYSFVTVRGDGFQSLGQLIDRARAGCTDPQEAELYKQDRRSRTLIDQQGLALDDVVESGRIVRLRSKPGPPPGPNKQVSVLEDLHPDLAEMAVRAAGALGLRIAGVDVITSDASLPPLEAGARLLEVNPKPDLDVFRFLTPPQDIDRTVFESACPPGDGSIPVVLGDGSDACDRLLSGLEARLQQQGQVVGFWSGEQGRVGGVTLPWVAGEGSREAPGQLVLSDERVDVALMNLTAESWLADGHPCSRSRVGVLLEGDGLLAQGLLPEWLMVAQGPVVVVDGQPALLEAVGTQVGDRLLAVAGEGEALETLLRLLDQASPFV